MHILEAFSIPKLEDSVEVSDMSHVGALVHVPRDNSTTFFLCSSS